MKVPLKRLKEMGGISSIAYSNKVQIESFLDRSSGISGSFDGMRRRL